MTTVTLTGDTDTGGVQKDWYIQQGSTTRAKDFAMTIDDTPMEITKVEMVLKQCGYVKHTYSSETSGFTVDVNGEFTWDEHILDLPQGDYEYDLKITHGAESQIDRVMHGVVHVRAKVTP
jgi:hypothetical protein